jgi:hypothetical protein
VNDVGYINLNPNIPAIHGEAVAGEAATVRKTLEATINNSHATNFDIAELMHKVKKNGYFRPDFNTWQDYVATLKIKPRKAQYLRNMADVMDQLNVTRTVYEPLGIARLREITSLDPNGEWVNPETAEKVPMRDFILGFIEKGETISLDDLKSHIRTLKGLVGENDLTWRHLCMTRAAAEGTWDTAIHLAKNHIGSVGKDDEGISKDASDGAAAEVIAVSFLNDPANQVLAEGE